MKNMTFALIALLAVSAAPQGQPATRPLPKRARCRSVVSSRDWAKDFRQIPSTVIDKGVLRFIPYTSYRAGEYELNVYGDPAAPSCVEIGIHKDLLTKAEAKRNCIELFYTLFDDPEDRKLVGSLKLDVDKKVRNGITFEITPPTAEDAYGGWWISAYDEPGLDGSRASDDELADIIVTRRVVKKTGDEKKPEGGLVVDSATEGRWAGDDLKDARTRKDVAEEKQAVYKPTFSKKGGKYVPDRTADDTGYIMFVCSNSPKHEDKEEFLKACASCAKESTFFWDLEKKGFVCFQCGAPFPNDKVKCPECGAVPRRVRTKHK